MAGYDGIELSAIDGMSQHLVLDRWEELVPEIRDLSQEYGLELLAMEQPRRDPDVMDRACRAALALGVPVVNTGPGGTSDDEESLKASIKSLAEMAKIGEEHGCHDMRQGARRSQHLQHANDASRDGRKSIHPRLASTWTRRTSTERGRTHRKLSRP